MSGEMIVDAKFIRYGAFILNRCDVSEVDFKSESVLMRSGRKYSIPRAVLEGCFCDIYDYKKNWQ